MLNTYQYFILTKFNLRFRGADTGGKSENKEQAHVWLEKRFQLFREFCFPSLEGQLDKDFIWLCFFDLNTPEKYKEIILKYADSMRNFHPVFSDAYANVSVEPFNKEIYKHLKSNTTHVITTRLDNDDALSKKFIFIIKSQLKEKDDYFINCVKGVQYDCNNGYMNRCIQYSNPFITRVERIIDGKIKSVIFLEHHLSARQAEIYNIREPDMWMQVIHDSNLLNEFYIKSIPVLNSEKVKQQFSVENFLEVNSGKTIIHYFNKGFYKLKTKIINA